jgi:putative membrane protein
MKRIAILPVAFAAMLSFACNTNRDTAEEESSTVGTSGDTVSAGDRDFVENLLHAGMAEVELGKLAMERAANADVKQFGSMMVQDHSKSGEALKQIASQHAIPAPSQLDEENLDARNKLSRLQGADFDREYMNLMVQKHENVVDRLQTRASEDRIGDNKGAVKPESSSNPVESSVNEWAANTLPTTRHHLEEAKRIDEQLENARSTR